MTNNNFTREGLVNNCCAIDWLQERDSLVNHTLIQDSYCGIRFTENTDTGTLVSNLRVNNMTSYGLYLHYNPPYFKNIVIGKTGGYGIISAAPLGGTTFENLILSETSQWISMTGTNTLTFKNSTYNQSSGSIRIPGQFQITAGQVTQEKLNNLTNREIL